MFQNLRFLPVGFLLVAASLWGIFGYRLYSADFTKAEYCEPALEQDLAVINESTVAAVLDGHTHCALALAKIALSTVTEAPSTFSEEVFNAYNNAATLSFDLEEFEDAATYYKSALDHLRLSSETCAYQNRYCLKLANANIRLAYTYDIIGESDNAQFLLYTSRRLKERYLVESPTKEPKLLSPEDVQPKQDHIIEVLFGTNRNVEAEKKELEFGSQLDSIRYGSLNVSIPALHKFGELERPTQWLFKSEDINKHIVIVDDSKRVMDRKEFFEYLSQEIDSAEESDLFVFIHGFATSFDDAALRTAQMAHDLNFKGVPMFFSWPSKGRFGIDTYRKDEQAVDAAFQDLASFIKDLTQNSESKKIHFVAHSMGNRIFLRALNKAVNQLAPKDKDRINQIILAAPDISKSEFKKIVPKIRPHVSGLTLYASAGDKAMFGSKLLRMRKKTTPTGSSKGGILVLDGMDSIDATLVDSTFLGHSYYAENRSVLNDVKLIFDFGKPAAERDTLDTKIDKDTNKITYLMQPCPPQALVC